MKHPPSSQLQPAGGQADKAEPAKLVSIVLSTYNGESFLAKQLESLLLQSYQNIEIIAVDDCSSDDTMNILHAYAAIHPHIRVFQNEVNLGFIKNFDKGCGLAKGELIALCDQDDYWHADKIKKMVESIAGYSMIYCDSLLCDEQLQPTGRRISDIVNCRPFDNCLQQAVFCRIYGHATLITRDLYNSAHPFLEVIPHDWWLSFVATLRNGITYLDDTLVYYRQHATNLFGAVGGKRRKHHKENKREKKRLERMKIRTRVAAFYDACPAEKTKEKSVLHDLSGSYQSFSLGNNIRRVILFLRYRNLFLLVKKHAALHRFLFCFKMFTKIS